MYITNKFEGKIYQRLNKILESYNQDQNSIINLAACISYPFNEVLKIQSFPLSTLPTEGVVEKRYFPHCTSLDDIEVYAEELCCKLFNLRSNDYRVSLQPNSGTQANQIVYNGILERDDFILSLSPKDGGHISHTYTGRGKVIYYHLDNNLKVDFTELRELLELYKPKLIVVGASSYGNEFNYKKIYKTVKEISPDTLILADICHSVLYIMADIHQAIFPFVDFATFTMDKCLRGPQGGVLVYRSSFEREISYSIFPRTQGGPTQSALFAKCICLIKLLSIDIQSYAKEVLKNTQLLIDCLTSYGIDVIYKQSKTHVVLINLSNLNFNGKEAEELLFEHRILVNRNQIPNDIYGPMTTSGIRLGTVGITNLGYTEADIQKLAELVANLLKYKQFNYSIHSELISKYHKQINISN